MLPASTWLSICIKCVHRACQVANNCYLCGLETHETIYDMTKAIITVVGRDTVGIIARVCTHLAESQINILDISQTIVQDYFNMMMIVDMSHSSKEFGVVSDELRRLGEEIGVQVKCQLEDIFDKMHRV